MSSNLELIFSQFNFNAANDSQRMIYVFEEFRLDPTHRMLYRGEKEIALPPKAIETLLAFVTRRGEILSKDELMNIIWADAVVEESNLSHYLHVLRKTLGNKSDGKPFIETLRRRGYRFDAEVQVIEERAESKSDKQDFDQPVFQPPHRENGHAQIVYRENKIGNEPLSVSTVVTAKTNWRLILAAVTFTGVFALTTFLILQSQPISKTAPPAKAEMSITHLTNGNSVLHPTISPDGKYFVYHEQDGETSRLWLQQTGQPNRIELIPPAARFFSSQTFSPNGKFIYFGKMEKGETQFSLYRIPTLGGGMTKILSNVYSPVSFSPDGKEMVFSRYDEETKNFPLVIAASDGSREKVLLRRDAAESASSANAWSPDGKTIVFGATNLKSIYTEGGCLLMSVEVQTGVVKPLSNEKWDNCFRLVWTRDGEGIVFVGTRIGETETTRREQIYYLSAATGESRRISTDVSRYQGWGISVTDDNSILAVPHNRSSQIWAMDAGGDSRTAVQLTTGMADGRAGIAPLPDGRIGYITRISEDVALWTMNADGTDQKQINSEPSFIEELRATPDGRYFIFAGKRDKRYYLYRLDADGSNLTQLTDGSSIVVDTAVSPDGKWVFYGSTVHDGNRYNVSLQKTSLEEGETIYLRNTGSSKMVVPHFSPDGKFISDIWWEDKVQIYTAEDFKPVKTFETVKHSALNLGARWTPDGKYLTYIVQKNTVSNVWKQPVDGGEPQPLTDFTSGEIYNYAFSADGSRLYLSRGYQIRNAILIRNFK